MQRGDAQRKQIQRQSVARPAHGMAIDSLQSGRIAQLQTMQATNARPSRLAQIAAMADQGPRVTAQHRIAGALNNRPRATGHRLQLDRLAGETGHREEADQPLQAQVAQRATGNAAPNRTGLSDQLKSGIEAGSGIAMSSVRVHYNASQPAQLDALADTQGADSHVAPGPEQHLPHEARHAAQQAHGSVQPTTQLSAGVAVNDAAGLEHEADAMGARALLHAAWKSGPRAAELMAPPVNLNRVTQAFGINDRQWDQVTEVTRLGAIAYKAAAADGGAVVIKKSGAGLVSETFGTEGPTQEALAAKVGEIPGFGVKTVKTEMIRTAGTEGRAILARLRSLGGMAAQLAENLAATEVFLVMELAPGETVEKSGPVIVSVSAELNASWFYGLGRLWVFDVLLDNTDRFELKNWGNAIFGKDGRVYGIDQMVGARASNRGIAGGMAQEYAVEKIAVVINSGSRRRCSKAIFSALSEKLGQAFSGMESAFISNFETGMLDGLIGAATVRQSDLERKQGELPAFARSAAQSLGLGGTGVMLQALASRPAEAIAVRSAWLEQMELRKADAKCIAAVLHPLAARRAELLHRLMDATIRLMTEWAETKDRLGEAKCKEYWMQKNLKEAEFLRFQEYFDLSGEFSVLTRELRDREILQDQLLEWQADLCRLHGRVVELNQGLSCSDEVKTRIKDLQMSIQEELDRKTIPERF